MRVEVLARPSSIGFDDLRSVDRNLRERVDCHKHNTTVGIYLMLGVSLLDDMQNCDPIRSD